MARKPRGELEAGVSHVFARGNNHQAIFLTREDFEIYLLLMADVIQRTGWRVLAWCLMGNHVHLVIETVEPNLGSGMQRLHGNYAQGFNDRHSRKNHLFGERYKRVAVTGDDHLWTLIRYVARNPVEAGLAATPGSYAWSSHRHVGRDTAPRVLDVPRLLEHFSSRGGDLLVRYHRFIEPPT